MPSRIKRPRACNSRYGASRFQVSSRKRVSRCKPVLAGALNKDIAIEQLDDFERGVEERPFEAELNQHQQHGKANAAARSHQTRLVRHQIPPRERNKPDRSWRASGVRSCDHPNRSAGSARRRLLMESKAEAAAIARVAANTAAIRAPDISTGSKVSSRITA